MCYLTPSNMAGARALIVSTTSLHSLSCTSFIVMCSVFLFLQSESFSAVAGDDHDTSSTEEVPVGKPEAVGKDEVITFHTNCSHCNSPTETRMKLVGILKSPTMHTTSIASYFKFINPKIMQIPWRIFQWPLLSVTFSRLL